VTPPPDVFRGDDGIGPEECPPEVGATVEPADLVHGLLSVAAIPANQDVLDAALRLVVALARVTVNGADGVSVSLVRHGTLTTVAASDETVKGMDRDQYATGEGPCVAAATEGHGSTSSRSTTSAGGRRSSPGPRNAASTASSRPRW
jgi:hypothetical protein